ncbi:MAG TPA: tetratricopeptide repeat protein [Polyangiales bacterium]|nr:tetratricopeptide repeat protein [Polyangiales bacterium]
MSEANPAEQDSLLGARIDGRYSVLQELGRGGMGVVYEGVHDELGRPVAIKVLNLAWATDPTAVARFLREARTASQFSHPNIVDVTDLGRLPDGRPYLVMPKIVGTDLAALLCDSGVQPAKRVAQLLSGVAAALDLIHARGFVHRDIKPENLMYVVRDDGSETVMLLDFGIAAAVMSNEPRLTGQGAIFGTPQFMPPEVCNGGMPDARGDVYALATVAFELITGDLPFGGENMMHVLTNKLTRDPPPLSEIAGVTFPPALENVISKGLARDPVQRWSRASEFINALKLATDDAPVSWRSGVLRPSMPSDLHPVASQPGALPQRTRTGRSRAQLIPSQQLPQQDWTRQSGRPPSAANDPAYARQRSDRSPAPSSGYPHDDAPRSRSDRNPAPGADYPHDPRNVAERDTATGADYPYDAPRHSGRAYGSHRPGSRTPSDRGGYAYDPHGYEPEPPRTRSAPRLIEDDDYGPGHLGTGPRERKRASSHVERPGGNGRIVVLLGILGALAGILWLRERNPDTAVIGPHLKKPEAPVSAPSQEPKAAQAEPAKVQQPTAAQPATEQPRQQPQAAEPSQPNAEPELAETAPLAATKPSEVVPPPAATPQTPTPSPAQAAQATSSAAAKSPPPPSAARAPVVAKAAPPVEPPAPEHESTASAPIESTDEPVLVVQETAPVEPEEPELPVRPPSAQAASLTRDATSALLGGEVGRAIDLLQEATRLDPGHSMAWRTLGLAYERGGNTQEAINAYEQYIRLAPHGPQSDMVRERMRVLEQ